MDGEAIPGGAVIPLRKSGLGRWRKTRESVGEFRVPSSTEVGLQGWSGLI